MEIEALESEYALEKARAELAAARRNRENMLRSFNQLFCAGTSILETMIIDIRLESQLCTIFRDYDYYLWREPYQQGVRIKQAERQLALLEQKKEDHGQISIEYEYCKWAKRKITITPTAGHRDPEWKPGSKWCAKAGYRGRGEGKHISRPPAAVKTQKT